MTTIQPTREVAIKVNRLLSHGLVKGMGVQEPGKMCIEAAVCCALGLPHSDDPACVSRAVRSFKITLNDANWSGNIARAKGLQRMAVAQLGSDGIDESLFVKELALSCVRKIVPIALRAAARLQNTEHCEKLNAEALKCEAATVDNMKDAAYSAARAAGAAAYSAADAADAAADEVLSLMAECGVEALIKCKSPGCEWLDVCKPF